MSSVKNKPSKKSCDCFIGKLTDRDITISTIKFEVQSLANIQPIFKECGLLKGEPDTVEQIVDGRKGYLRKFLHCPYCGEKINWKDILSTIK